MLRVDNAVLELTYNWRWSYLRVIVDDTPEDIIALRNQLRDVFDEAEKMEVIYVDGRCLWRGKMWGMKPKDRERLRAMRKKK
jgi:hypothetical protein